MAIRCVAQPYASAHVECYLVSHKRLVAIVVDKRPLLALGRSIGQNGLLLGEFQSHRLLGEIPAGISAPLTLCILLAEKARASIGDNVHCRVYLVVLRLHHAHSISIHHHQW